MHDLPEVLTRLSTRVDALEERVSLLEHTSPAVISAGPSEEHAEATARNGSSLADAGATFAVFGRAMLGMAGAYVLRAVAESGSFPKLAVVALAIAYAGTWLVVAARVPAQQWISSAIYTGTSALILAPMLWELTLRFGVLTPGYAAAVLGVFLAASYAIAWTRNLTAVVGIASLTVAVASIGLLIATRQMTAFIAVLLLMALLSEAAALRERWSRLRLIAALAADSAGCMLLYIYSRPESDRTNYDSLGTTALVAPACILLLIYGASVVLRTVVRRQQISLFETFQTVVAFALASESVLHFAGPSASALFGIVCVALSASGYGALFHRFHPLDQRRNYNVFATWSAGLLLLGCFVCLTPGWLPSSLGTAAILLTSLAVKYSRLTLAFHGLAYLTTATIVSGSFAYTAHALAGAFPGAPSEIVWMLSAAAFLCYVIGAQSHEGRWGQRLFQLLSAALAVSLLAALSVSAMVWITATVITPGASHVAVIRTLAACFFALGLAFVGSLWSRVELIWMSYAAVALVTAKLLFEDLRQGHPEFIAASIFLYAVTLILVPRVARKSPRKPAALPTADAVAKPELARPR